MISQIQGAPVSATATHATSAVASVTGATNTTYYVTDISGSSDKAGALILIKDGTTVIWQDRVSNTAAYTKTFSTPLKATSGNLISATVDGTAMCNANIAGVAITAG